MSVWSLLLCAYYSHYFYNRLNIFIINDVRNLICFKVVESSTCSLPQIPEDKDDQKVGVNTEANESNSNIRRFPPLLPAPIKKYYAGRFLHIS